MSTVTIDLNNPVTKQTSYHLNTYWNNIYLRYQSQNWILM